ncbi:MAG: NADH-quinone oxidoreductase subunit L [Thermoprotei archaeon]|nr:MAG: NADH-quinone oxidoreductase subunit L [Thermoprotei archaeon]
MSLATISLLIPLLPLVSSAIVPLMIRVRRRYVELFSVIITGISLVLSLVLLMDVVLNRYELPLFIRYTSSIPSFSIFIDELTLVMLLIVPIVSFLVVVFSLGYMKEDEAYIRYYTFILLFIGGMLGLVLVGNFLYLYLFWEVVGITSCCLIAHWYRRPEASKAGVKAFIVTRIGDTFLLASIALIYLRFGTLSYRDLISKMMLSSTITSPPINIAKLLTIPLILAFIGAMGKSAQFPLHVWLPDAMEGPTTVSALIHAATMVKAGVYLIARFETLLHYSGINPVLLMPFFKTVVLIGGFTSLFSATMALVALDVKRVLAYSTISQLGLMFLALGLGGYVGLHEAFTAGVSHMLSHAYFKALLFLSAGAVIHALETRDMRLMGGLRKYMPITCTAMTIGALSLMGFPPLSGFISKEEILKVASEAMKVMPWGSIFFTLTSILTAFYSLRLVYLVFFAPPSEYVTKHKPHEAESVMTIPLISLMVLCFIAPTFLLYVLEGYKIEVHIHGLLKSAMILALGAGSAYLIYFKEVISRERVLALRPITVINDILFNGYYIDFFYERVLLKVLMGLPSYIASVIEQGINFIIDRASVIILGSLPSYIAFLVDSGVEAFNNALVRLFVNLSNILRSLHTGEIHHYVSSVIVGLVLVLLIILVGVMML